MTEARKPNGAGPSHPWLVRGGIVLGCLLALGASLGFHTIRYVVRSSATATAVEVCGAVVAGPRISAGETFTVRLAPQERFSTAQFLLEDRGLLSNGFRALGLLLSGSKGEGAVDGFRQTVGTTAAYVQFNPFRASLLLFEGGKDLRADVNVPDDSIELWKGGAKLDQRKLLPPWLRLTFGPFAGAAFLAGLLVALLVPFSRPGTDLATAAIDRRRVELALPLLVGLAGAFVVWRLLFGVFHAVPGFGDEMNYLMQGRIFASGHLAVPEPPDAEFFRVGWMDMFGADGKIWGFHPPGNAALLAVGWLTGWYWLTIPLMGGLLLATSYLLGLELFGTRTWALLYVGMVATSHYVLSLAASFMAHAPSFVFLSLFALAILRFFRTERGTFLVLAALWLGVAFTIRPLSAALAGAVPLVLVLVRFRRRLLGPALVALAVGAAVSSLVFLYTYGITGRVAFPYAIKGPEVGQTILVRLGKGWTTHFSNLYRNTDEFAHRVHSFGILGNLVPFFVPLLFLRASPHRRWFAAAYASLAFFVVGHSLLHWYGWKWEPRMLFDVSFVFFLVSTAGVAALAGEEPGLRRKLVLGGALAALGWAAAVDVPRRFRTEYANYNAAPAGVRESLERGELRNAVLFFGAEQAFACYSPMNAVDYAGDAVFAKSQGDISNYRLLERFPTKAAFFTPDGNTIVARPNFYRSDLETLADELRRLGGGRPVAVLPWRGVAPTPLDDRLGAEVLDPGQFLQKLMKDPQEGRLVAFVEGAVELATLVDLSHRTEAPPLHAKFAGPVAVRRIGPRREESGGLPGFWMSCWAGTEWKGKPLGQWITASLDTAPCSGEQRSMSWDARFALSRPTTFDFSVESDDGAGLFIDGRLLLDNDLRNTHGPERKKTTVSLEPGLHSFRVLYFNGPGDGRLEVTAAEGSRTVGKVSVAAFLPDFHFVVDPGGPPSEVNLP